METIIKMLLKIKININNNMSGYQAIQKSHVTTNKTHLVSKMTRNLP
jgi:hypothetical protein